MSTSPPLPGHRRRLDEQHVAADAGHRQTRRHARDGRARRRFVEDLRPAERLAHGRRIDHDRRRLRSPDAIRVAVLRSSVPELALELADAGLARVVGDDQAQHVVVDRHFVGAQAVALDLPRPEIAARDRDLLIGGVAVEADHFHAVEQRRRESCRPRSPWR